MTLKERISQDLQSALRSGDELRKNTLRQLLAGIRHSELEKRTVLARRISGAGELSAAELDQLEHIRLEDTEVLDVIQKEAKSRRESILDAERARRSDLVSGYQAELNILEDYLPKQLTAAEVEALARQAISEAGATDARHMGAVMKLLSPRTKGQADGKLVSDVVRRLLAG
jgi:uncharacterized protein